MEKVRIQKIIADSGLCSRRKAEELIEKGKVKVNGHPCKLGDKALPGKDMITVGGELITVDKRRKLYYIMLHKPRGYVTTTSDELGRKCVTELLENIPERVYPIGRLDKDSEGLLLFTNDGGFANDMMHPSRHISKTYRVTVRPDITEQQLVQLASGVEIDGRKTAECNVVVLDKQVGRVVLQMTIFEGRNRQIRKMCEAVGLEVARLKRTAVGPVKLGMLKPGSFRELKPDELRALRNAVTKKQG
ncbi:MAG: rRNA pseudouridine synthase [Ruminococcus sp.]|jgi:23S rRNA pseudouridine2605 synthase|nr:rRNA pseudouridine synthase [Ruminococcus sp.]MBQ4247768.1 rRNA pseudouridine synthase [Ruminococcus sp.]